MKSLNKVQLIGNLTRDPELRYTPQGTAVVTFGLATNRGWVTDTGERKEEAEFHRVVAWNKLAEIISQLLFKGRRVYIEGRLQTRSWTGKDGVDRQTTEIVASEMIILDSRGAPGDGLAPEEPMPEEPEDAEPVSKKPATPGAAAKAGAGGQKKASDGKKKKKKTDSDEDEVNADDIPF